MADWRKSGVKNREMLHLQRPRYSSAVDRGAGKSQLVADGNPGGWTDVPAD
jgi:hypothetical protein